LRYLKKRNGGLRRGFCSLSEHNRSTGTSLFWQNKCVTALFP